MRWQASRERELIEHLPHEVHVWEVLRRGDGSIRTWRLDYANPAALRAWGRRLEEVVGLTTDEIFESNAVTPLFLPIVEKLFREGKPYLWEEEFPETGQTLQMVSIPFREYFISTGLDISEQKRKDQEVRQLQKMDALGQLVGGAAHDFNNQLAGIAGNAELLRRQLVDSPLLEEIEAISECSRRSATLISQLLTFARKGPLDRYGRHRSARGRDRGPAEAHDQQKDRDLVPLQQHRRNACPW